MIKYSYFIIEMGNSQSIQNSVNILEYLAMDLSY